MSDKITTCQYEMMKKDKQKVIGEELSDERIRSFLDVKPEAGVNRDYCILVKAYRSLRGDDFVRFLIFFREAGLNPNAEGPDGRSLLEELREYRMAASYLQALEATDLK